MTKRQTIYRCERCGALYVDPKWLFCDTGHAAHNEGPQHHYDPLWRPKLVPWLDVRNNELLDHLTIIVPHGMDLESDEATNE